jgi:hypothetical protein
MAVLSMIRSVFVRNQMPRRPRPENLGGFPGVAARQDTDAVALAQADVTITDYGLW